MSNANTGCASPFAGGKYAILKLLCKWECLVPALIYTKWQKYPGTYPNSGLFLAKFAALKRMRSTNFIPLPT